MKVARSIADTFGGDDPKMRRLITYWCATVLLYLLSLSILWVEVITGVANVQTAAALTAIAITGHMFFYVLIRQCKQLDLTPAQLSLYQGRFAIFCTVVGYAVMGPLRGVTLVLLTVILVFCAFTLEAQKTHSLSVFAIGLLGAAMVWMGFAAPHIFNAKTELIHFILSGSMLLVVAILTGRLSELRQTLKAQKEELIEALAHIQALATRDDLTSLPNRRFMGDLLHDEERRRTTDGSCACVALLDIDWFKKINDQFGHAAGDDVLRRFSEEGRRNLRENDVLARWGGEEFLMYLPGTSMSDAKGVLERLRLQVQSLQFQSEGVQFGITVSGGLVELFPGEPIEAAIRRADTLLYQAKSDGRNRVVTAN